MNFEISRKKTLNAVETAMKQHEKIVLLTQKNPDELDPNEVVVPSLFVDYIVEKRS
jgi:acyl CoA:acetate/3-ketoacid CoA transferase alpha subunit